MAPTPVSAWYEDFFTELPNAFWRAAMPPQRTAAEVDFIVGLAGIHPGARVLDVPCGSGRHSLELARRGYRVTALDISAEAIDHLRAAAAAAGVVVDARVADMRTLPADVAADAVIHMGNAFGYLEHAATQDFLATLVGVLPPGGPVVVDYGFVAESLLPQLTLDEEPMQLGGVEAISENSYDTANSRLITSFTFRRGSHEHRGTSVQHVYTAAEVSRLVTAAGLTDIERYGDVDGTPYELGSHRLVLVARRPAAPLGPGSG